MTFGRLPRLALLLLAMLVALVGFVPAAGAAKVAARATVHANHKTITLGKTVTLRGTVSPDLHGHRAVLQVRKGSHWKTVKRARLNGASKYKLTVRPKSTGLKRYRVWVAATKQTKAGASKTVKVRVKARSGGSGSGGGSASRCTPGYSPCIPPASDVDCAGGSGDGPAYVDGPVYVTGSDPYDLDRDGDGVGCSS